jgi:proteasome lid subunit RPN8/RPN11
VLTAVVEHARETQPAECCGLLIGRGREIRESVRAGNLAADPNRFFIDPKDHIDARRAARDRGLDLVGFYHSHPRSEACPSPTDVAEATYPECVYLIVGLKTQPPAARLFAMGRGSFQELALEIQDVRISGSTPDGQAG